MRFSGVTAAFFKGVEMNKIIKSVLIVLAFIVGGIAFGLLINYLTIFFSWFSDFWLNLWKGIVSYMEINFSQNQRFLIGLSAIFGVIGLFLGVAVVIDDWNEK
jgi:hypothetical protein